MSDDVATRVRKVIASATELELSAVTLDSTTENLGVDSMMMVDLIFSLEEEFDCTVPFNSNDQSQSNFSMSTVADVVKMMEKLEQEKA